MVSLVASNLPFCAVDITRNSIRGSFLAGWCSAHGLTVQNDVEDFK